MLRAGDRLFGLDRAAGGNPLSHIHMPPGCHVWSLKNTERKTEREIERGKGKKRGEKRVKNSWSESTSWK